MGDRMMGPTHRRSETSDSLDTVPAQSIDERDRERPELSVVIPAYNEEDSVGETVTAVESVVSSVCPSHEIVVVDDGSDDRTRAALRTLAAAIETVGIVLRDENQGKGKAIRDGCLAASGEYVLVLDADGELEPSQIEAFLARTGRDGADVVIGSKRHPDSEVAYPRRRRLLSEAYSRMVRILFGLQVTDTQVGMKLLRQDAVERIMPLILVDGYAFDVELLALARRYGFSVVEAPVTVDFEGDSGVDWPAIVRIGLDTMGVFCRMKLMGSYEKLAQAVEYAQQTEGGASNR